MRALSERVKTRKSRHNSPGKPRLRCLLFSHTPDLLTDQRRLDPQGYLRHSSLYGPSRIGA